MLDLRFIEENIDIYIYNHQEPPSIFLVYPNQVVFAARHSMHSNGTTRTVSDHTPTQHLSASASFSGYKKSLAC